jgi:hypothetical protein
MQLAFMQSYLLWARPIPYPVFGNPDSLLEIDNC